MPPLTPLRPETARALWSGLAATLVTFLALSRFEFHSFAVLASKCMSRALALAQWSPWFFVGALVLPVQFIAVAKPTLALLAFPYRPSRWLLVGTALLVPASFALRPMWLREWRTATQAVSYYGPAAAVWQGGGPLLLLAALRW